jgi:hypothetical protein
MNEIKHHLGPDIEVAEHFTPRYSIIENNIFLKTFREKTKILCILYTVFLLIISLIDNDII